MRPAWHDGRVDAAAVDAAATALRHGAVVGLPTETVYGLAARTADAAAVARVFAIKGRPADHPVIVHVEDADAVRRWGHDAPPYAVALAAAMWPGPLTVVVPAADEVPRYVTGGQDTVGLRCPAHPVALAVIAAAGPLAAPSANRFGQVSPTRASDVVADIGDRMAAGDLVLDGGPSPVGVESTILDCTGPRPKVLRWGAVEVAQIEAAAGIRLVDDPSTVRAPGGLASHYAPAATVRIGAGAGAGEGLLAPAGHPTPPGAVRLASPATTRDYAAVLYRALRDADELGVPVVWAVPPDGGTALAAAVRDRLTRAAHQG